MYPRNELPHVRSLAGNTVHMYFARKASGFYHPVYHRTKRRKPRGPIYAGKVLFGPPALGRARRGEGRLPDYTLEHWPAKSGRGPEIPWRPYPAAQRTFTDVPETQKEHSKRDSTFVPAGPTFIGPCEPETSIKRRQIPMPRGKGREEPHLSGTGSARVREPPASHRRVAYPTVLRTAR